MKDRMLGLSALLNLLLLGVLVFLNERYGLWAKVQQVVLEEGRVPGIVPQHELNREYQVRREMFRLDKNKSARVLMLGDSLTAQGEWNAMLGEPLVANRGIDARLAEGAGENGYRFVELESVLADENGFLRGELTSDGVHLSAKGCMEVIQRLKEVGLWPMAEG